MTNCTAATAFKSMDTHSAPHSLKLHFCTEANRFKSVQRFLAMLGPVSLLDVWDCRPAAACDSDEPRPACKPVTMALPLKV